MPCYTEPPTRAEIEAKRLNDLLDEIEGTRLRTGDIGRMSSRPLTLDQMTQRLCAWCGAHDVKQQSLELQIWWRDHQAWDARRLADEQKAARRVQLRKQALAKLTPEEREALDK